MAGTGTYDMSANRWQPFTDYLIFEARDFTGATFAMQIRGFKDGGSALVDLGNATAPAEGISGTVTFTEGVPESRVDIRIDKATIDGLPFTNPRGGNLELAYDLHVTPSAGTENREIEGTFTVRSGVTQ